MCGICKRGCRQAYPAFHSVMISVRIRYNEALPDMSLFLPGPVIGGRALTVPPAVSPHIGHGGAQSCKRSERSQRCGGRLRFGGHSTDQSQGLRSSVHGIGGGLICAHFALFCFLFFFFGGRTVNNQSCGLKVRIQCCILSCLLVDRSFPKIHIE